MVSACAIQEHVARFPGLVKQIKEETMSRVLQKGLDEASAQVQSWWKCWDDGVHFDRSIGFKVDCPIVQLVTCLYCTATPHERTAWARQITPTPSELPLPAHIAYGAV